MPNAGVVQRWRRIFHPFRVVPLRRALPVREPAWGVTVRRKDREHLETVRAHGADDVTKDQIGPIFTMED